MSTVPAPSVPRHRPPLVARWLGYGLVAVVVFVLAYLVAVQVRDGNFDGYIYVSFLIAIAIIASATFVLALWISALFDVFDYTDDTWAAAGYLRWVWFGVTFWLGPVGALLWYVAVRPRMVQAEQKTDR